MLNYALLTQIMTKRYRPWLNKCYLHKVQKYRYPKSIKILILSRTSFWADLWADCPILSGVFLCNKTGGLAINLYRKLNTYAKDLNFSRICSRLVDVRVDMNPYCLKSSWKWFFRHLLQTFFIVFLYNFFTCFVHGDELSKYLVHNIIFSSKCS